MDATEDDLACIQSVKVKTMDGAKGKSVEREVRLNDKMKALELLGKHLGMFKDKLEVDADMDLNITIDYGDNNGSGRRMRVLILIWKNQFHFLMMQWLCYVIPSRKSVRLSRN